MYTNYDQAVEKLVQNKRDNGMSDTVIYSFKHHARELKEFLILRGIPFVLSAVKEWIHKRKTETTYGTFKQLRHTIAEIVKFLMPDVNVMVEFYEFTTSYQRLEIWTKTQLNEFLHIYPYNYNELRQAISLMLEFFQEKGLKSFSEVSCLLVVEYRKIPGSHRGRGIRQFLAFLNSKGLIGPFISESYNIFFYNRILILQKNSYCEGEITYSIDEYSRAGTRLMEILEEINYSKTVRKTAKSAVIEFGIFLVSNNLKFSKILVDKWLTLRSLEKNTTVPSYRKSLYQITDLLKSEKDFDISKKYLKINRAPLPHWIETYANKYLAIREKAGLAKSTLAMDFTAIRRFFLYAEKEGCTNLKDLTVEIIKHFHKTDIHKTIEGKAAYNVRIRGFFSYLTVEEILPEYFPYALSTSSNVGSKPARILSADEIKIIEKIILEPTVGRSAKRDSAILAIGLLCGLRASDIVKMKFSEISWASQEFSIIQQKTRKHLRIPFPNLIGNRLYSYITDERPDSTSEFVFINRRAPFFPITTSCCHSTIRRVTNNEVTGFHILRKTFASSLLGIGSSISLITDMLGHKSESSIDPYLDTNMIMMTKCSLSLDGIEYRGGAL
jgi:integrase